MGGRLGFGSKMVPVMLCMIAYIRVFGFVGCSVSPLKLDIESLPSSPNPCSVAASHGPRNPDSCSRRASGAGWSLSFGFGFQGEPLQLVLFPSVRMTLPLTTQKKRAKLAPPVRFKGEWRPGVVEPKER